MRHGLHGYRAIARLAEAQHGVVSRGQLLALGLSSHSIRHRISRGYLHPVHRGVYRVGHTAPLTWAQEIAAVLACGPSAVLSHRSAAVVWALQAEPHGDVDVIVPDRGRQQRPGIRVHRSRLSPNEFTRRHGMPVTTPLRTILDLAAVARPAELELAVAEAERRRLVTTRKVRMAIERSPRRAGVVQLRGLLDRLDGPALTRSKAERELLRLVRAAGLPAPEHNVAVGRQVVDLLWRDEGLVAEVDGYAYHSGRAAFERDRLRDADLLARGYRVLRVTWRQLVERPEAVVARLAEGLAAGRT